ncbi:uncharacterized protein KRP23_3316 [Phytophthora ramorum]|uniref:uncharacterized protein n=1 Tax=Phytophthora ramorum TaxID=164328 RepID=UPI0030AAD369|nr:hypothetical protein KRP23_3316 [Phytophthora ramorum]
MSAQRAFTKSFVKLVPRAQGYVFERMHDVIHVDENWFYVHCNRTTYYQSVNETVPLRTTKNKRHMTKVMLLMAMVRTRFLHNSKNRPADTSITLPIEMTKSVYERMLVEDVIPAIKACWRGERQVIFQEDNASPHGSAARTSVLESC